MQVPFDALIKVSPLLNPQGNRTHQLPYTWVSLKDVTFGDVRRTFYAIVRPDRPFQRSPKPERHKPLLHKRNVSMCPTANAFSTKGTLGKSRAFPPKGGRLLLAGHVSVNVMLFPSYNMSDPIVQL